MVPLVPTTLVLLHTIPVDPLNLLPQGLPLTQVPHTPSTTQHTTQHKPLTMGHTHHMGHTTLPITLLHTPILTLVPTVHLTQALTLAHILVPTQALTQAHTQALTLVLTLAHTQALTLVPTLAPIQDPMVGHTPAPMEALTEALTAMAALTQGHTWDSTVAAVVVGHTVAPMVGRMGATTEGRPTFKPQLA